MKTLLVKCLLMMIAVCSGIAVADETTNTTSIVRESNIQTGYIEAYASNEGETIYCGVPQGSTPKNWYIEPIGGGTRTVIEEGGNYEIEFDNSGLNEEGEYDYMLRLKQLRVEDSGVYVCEVTTPLDDGGTQTDEVRLVLTISPTTTDQATGISDGRLVLFTVLTFSFFCLFSTY